MLRRLVVVTCSALAAASASLAAEEPASGTLYTRVMDGMVRAAVVIQIRPGWNL